MAERLRAPESSSGVSDQQSVGSSPGHGTCVLEHDALPLLLCLSDGTVSRRFPALGLVVHVKEPRTPIMEELGLTPVFLVHIASTLIYRFPQACELQ